jgi:ribose 5-phosphate isomerase B
MSETADSEIRFIVQRVLARLTGPPAAGEKPVLQSPPSETPAGQPAPRKIVAIGADHGGYEMKEMLKAELHGMGYEVLDAGTFSKDPVDYPDIAHAVASRVRAGSVWRGIIVDGAGIGSCVVANKVPGIRAGMAYDYSSAVNSREHNDTNVLTLGAGLIGMNLARQIVQVWLATPFGGGRHAPRVDKMMAVEKQYLK